MTIADQAATFQQGLAAHQQGRLDEAEAHYRTVLAANPAHFGALHLTGLVQYQRGAYSSAVDWIGRAIATNPQSPEAHSNLGLALFELKRVEEALASHERALRLKPDVPASLNNRGNALLALDRMLDALADYDRALKLQPNFALAHNNRGNVLRMLGRYDEALAAYKRALQFVPDYAEALSNHGKLLVEQLAQPSEGLVSIDRSLQIRPDHANTWAIRGMALKLLGRFAEAMQAWEMALKTSPNEPYVRGRLLFARLECCDWHDYEHLRAEIEHGLLRGEPADEPWGLQVHCRSALVQLRAAEIFAAQENPVAAASLWKGERYGHDRLRIAWLSGGFGANVEAQTIVGFLEHTDRSHFETFGLSVGRADTSAMRQRIAAAFEHFIDARTWSDEQAANWVRDQEIDILVVVAPHMGVSRLGILRRRPAPLQVNFGFFGPIGTEYVDYVLADRFVAPPGREDTLCVEKMLRPAAATMSYYAPSLQVGAPPSRASLGLPETGFVFCSFNNYYKIQPDVFAAWMRLLRDVDGSVIWLRETNATARSNLQAEAAQRGIAPERLIFAPFVATYGDYLARFAAADLFLDAPPYGAQTTACEALWTGLPLVTIAGDTMMSRMTGSLLHAAGLGELVADDILDYERRIRALVAAPQRLSALRGTLAMARSSGNLFDPSGFCRRLEAGFTMMVERQRNGLSPDHIDVLWPTAD
ncbi:MAG: tetratricopeptide repeat protein [Enhydrobacter sp.]